MLFHAPYGRLVCDSMDGRGREDGSANLISGGKLLNRLYL